jgi:predicted nucleic acid-binding protein
MPPNQIVLDSSAVTFLASKSQRAALLADKLRAYGKLVVLSITLAECVPPPPKDAEVNRFLKDCKVNLEMPEMVARRASLARYRAGQGSAIDALVAAYAVGGAVVTGDRGDFEALAAHLPGLKVVAI